MQEMQGKIHRLIIFHVVRSLHCNNFCFCNRLISDRCFSCVESMGSCFVADGALCPSSSQIQVRVSVKAVTEHINYNPRLHISTTGCVQ